MVLDEAEVVVVGAGPAGAACAAALGELGHDVLLIDSAEPPRDKPCGGGVSPRGVELLRRLGLDAVVDAAQSVEGVRLIVEGSHERVFPYRHGTARCVARSTLDAALVTAASGRGARLLRGWVEGPVVSGAQCHGVRVRVGDRIGVVRARMVVAASGAATGIGWMGRPVPPAAVTVQAALQPCAITDAADPFFDVYLPLRHMGGGLVGYGWVFPRGAGGAAVGVTCMTSGATAAHPPMLDVLAGFFELLATEGEDRYGVLSASGSAVAGPIAADFVTTGVAIGGLAYVGDAARSADPITGEGITRALLGGDAIAQLVHTGLSRQGASLPSTQDARRTLARRLPRLGQDPGVLLRMATRRLAETRPLVRLPGLGRNGPLDNLVREIVTAEQDADLTACPVSREIERADLETAAVLDRVSVTLLDTLTSDLPLSTELSHRLVRARSGPALAAMTLLSCLAFGGEVTEALVVASIGAELVALLPKLAWQISDASGESATVGNGLSVLMIDIALSRALRAVAPTGSTNVEHLAKISGRLCEGAHLQGLDRWDVNRSAASYFAVAGMTNGAAMGLAAAIGARIAGCDATVVAAAERAGRELGLAMQIADDVAALVVGDPALGEPPGADLRDGNYTLPVIHALSAGAPELRERLRGPVAGDEVDQLIADILGADGVRRASDDCAVHQRAAEAILQRVGVLAGAPIMALVGLPTVRLRTAQSQSAA